MQLAYPEWIWGNEFVAPAATTQLVRIIPTVGRMGIVYGWHLVSQEATAAGKVARLRLSIAGTLVTPVTFDVAANLNPFISPNPIAALRGNGVDFIEIINVVAGVAATIYRAALLYVEVERYYPIIDAKQYDTFRMPVPGG